jgi:hypothetical protein
MYYYVLYLYYICVVLYEVPGMLFLVFLHPVSCVHVERPLLGLGD